MSGLSPDPKLWASALKTNDVISGARDHDWLAVMAALTTSADAYPVLMFCVRYCQGFRADENEEPTMEDIDKGWGF